MMTKEEYKKTYIRMMDSVRATHKGRANCEGVGYSVCPLTSVCSCRQGMLTSNAFECIELVEKWGKEHPIETNGDKFKEVFGFEIMKTPNDCAGLPCQSHCDTCPNKGFWGKEYKGESKWQR